MLKKLVLFSCIFFIASLIMAQPPGTVSQRLKAQKAEEADPIEEDYEQRIKKEMLYGVYIPKDVSDVFSQLNELTASDSRAKFKAMTEADARSKLHFSLGRWMIHNWGFYEGSRLSKHLNDIGLFEPDDMARALIVLYHRQLNEQPQELEQLVAEFQEIRRLEKEQKQANRKIISQETRKRPVKENK